MGSFKKDLEKENLNMSYEQIVPPCKLIINARISTYIRIRDLVYNRRKDL